MYSNQARLGGDLHDLFCGNDWSGLPYTVSLWREVSKIEGCKGASLDHLPAFITACRSTLLKHSKEVASARTSWALTFPGMLLLLWIEA